MPPLLPDGSSLVLQFEIQLKQRILKVLLQGQRPGTYQRCSKAIDRISDQIISLRYVKQRLKARPIRKFFLSRDVGGIGFSALKAFFGLDN